MILRLIERVRYGVYAVCLLPDDGCQVENFLREHRQGFPRAIRDLSSMIVQETPYHGPPFDKLELRARRIGHEICEYKATEKKRKDQLPRVLFFEDPRNRLVICTNAFMKPNPGSTPEGEKQVCIDLRALYVQEQEANISPRIVMGWAT